MLPPAFTEEPERLPVFGSCSSRFMKRQMVFVCNPARLSCSGGVLLAGCRLSCVPSLPETGAVGLFAILCFPSCSAISTPSSMCFIFGISHYPGVRDPRSVWVSSRLPCTAHSTRVLGGYQTG